MAYLTAEEVKQKRSRIKNLFPARDGWKFSVRKSKSSTKLYVDILSAPIDFSALKKEDQSWGFTFDPFWDTYKDSEGVGVLQEIHRIANEGNYDNSDSMTDYYDVGFYFSMGIGDWDNGLEFIDNGKSEQYTSFFTCNSIYAYKSGATIGEHAYPLPVWEWGINYRGVKLKGMKSKKVAEEIKGFIIETCVTDLEQKGAETYLDALARHGDKLLKLIIDSINSESEKQFSQFNDEHIQEGIGQDVEMEENDQDVAERLQDQKDALESSVAFEEHEAREIADSKQFYDENSIEYCLENGDTEGAAKIADSVAVSIFDLTEEELNAETEAQIRKDRRKLIQETGSADDMGFDDGLEPDKEEETPFEGCISELDRLDKIAEDYKKHRENVHLAIVTDEVNPSQVSTSGEGEDATSELKSGLESKIQGLSREFSDDDNARIIFMHNTREFVGMLTVDAIIVRSMIDFGKWKAEENDFTDMVAEAEEEALILQGKVSSLESRLDQISELLNQS